MAIGRLKSSGWAKNLTNMLWMTTNFSGKVKVSVQLEAQLDLSPLLERACNATRLSPPSASSISREGHSCRLDKPAKLSPSLARTTDKLLHPVLHPLVPSQVLELLNQPEETRGVPSQPLDQLVLHQLQRLGASLVVSNPPLILLRGSSLCPEDWPLLKIQSTLHPTLS